MLMLKSAKIKIDSYASGKTWYWYILPWLFGLYIFIKLFSFNLNEPMPFVVAVPHSFDFMLHEMSHILTGFLPGLLTALSGSASEILLGLALIFGAFKTRSYFASLFCFLWFMLACFSVAAYMADARAQELQLVSLGNGFSSSEGVIHDWNYIFGELGLLNLDKFFAGTVWLLGLMSGIFGLAFSAYMILKIANSPSASESMSDDEALLLQTTASVSGIKPPSTRHYKQNAKGSIYPEATKGRMAESQDSAEKDTKPTR